MTYEEWLNTPGLDRCYLVEVQYRLGSETAMFYRSTHPFRTGATDTPSYTPYPETIADMGEFDRDMTEVYIGRSLSQSSDIDFVIDDELRDVALNGFVGGLNVTILQGSPDWDYSQFVAVVKNAVAEDLTISSPDIVTLSFSDRASVFDTPIQPDLIASGPNQGKPEPLCFGRCFNVSPVLIDETSNLWQVHESDIEAVTVVRENGNAITDFIDNSDGTFTINRSVTGVITCDVDGAKPSGTWLQTGEEFIDYILAKHGFDAAVDVDVLPTYLLGLYIDSETNIDDVFDEIVSCFVASWRFDRQNQFRLALKQVAS